MKRRATEVDRDPELQAVLDKFEDRIDPRERLWHGLLRGPGRLRWWFTVRAVRRFHVSPVGHLIDLLFVLYLIALLGTLALGAFWAAYAFKSWLGIDLIPGFHLLGD